MLRFINTLLLVVMGALVVLLYQLKYESRQLEARAVKLTHEIEDERDNIAVLKAEWSLLTRPERIERLARKHLGLKPVDASQYVKTEWLSTVIKRRNLKTGAARNIKKQADRRRGDN